MDRFTPAAMPPVPGGMPGAAPMMSGAPPAMAGMMDQAMGKFSPTTAMAPQGPDQAAQKAYTDALTAGGQDPMRAATEAWKASAKQQADPNTPDAPGSENLRKIQQHLMQSKGLDGLTAWAIAHEALPRLASAGPPAAGGAPPPGAR